VSILGNGGGYYYSNQNFKSQQISASPNQTVTSTSAAGNQAVASTAGTAQSTVHPRPPRGSVSDDRDERLSSGTGGGHHHHHHHQTHTSSSSNASSIASGTGGTGGGGGGHHGYGSRNNSSNTSNTMASVATQAQTSVVASTQFDLEAAAFPPLPGVESGKGAAGGQLKQSASGECEFLNKHNL
jgi:hypothetical protein